MAQHLDVLSEASQLEGALIADLQLGEVRCEDLGLVRTVFGPQELNQLALEEALSCPFAILIEKVEESWFNLVDMRLE